MDQQVSFSSIIEGAAQLPFVQVNRTDFLTHNLNRLCTPEQMKTAIAMGTMYSGIPIETLDSVANAVINAETMKVTGISTVAGLPGGWAMAATVPADMAQFYAFVLRIAQELAYIYGWTEFVSSTSSSLDQGTESQLILFIGVMSGVGAANAAVAKLFGETAMKSVAKRIAAKALAKTWYYPIAKKIAAMLGQKMVKATFAKGVSKFVPIVGGLISGGLTLATFLPMSNRLKDYLSNMAHMTPDAFEDYVTALESETADSTAVTLTDEEQATDTKCWICVCGAKNLGKFCTECGQKKPDGLPQYRCDKCGWMPEDTTMPPKFCPECGDPFDESDIYVG